MMADPSAHEDPENSNGSSGGDASARLSTDSRSSSTRNQPLRLSHAPSPNHQHRHSLSESLRAGPNSPRNRRQPSFTQSAIQSLIDHPPPRNPADPAFAGRDWKDITIGELVSPHDLKFVEIDTGIEEATNILIEAETNVILIREAPESAKAIGTFDYADLNAYLLLAVGLVQPDEEQVTSFKELAKKARDGSKIPLKDVKDLGRKDPLVTLAASASVVKAIEIFGGGIHRVVVVDENQADVVLGVFSQFRLVKFLWENGRSFPAIDQLYPQYLKDLMIGSHTVISINGDKPLSEALQLMNSQGISSLAVVDNQHNVVGNISNVDVKLLTRSSSLPLLHNTCIHFISVILSTRGLIEGKDSFPVFHVNPGSTLAHTVAKLVATRSHRLWITDPLSPASSGPPTPSHSVVPFPMMLNASPPPELATDTDNTPLNDSSLLSNHTNSYVHTPYVQPMSPPGLPHAVSPSIPASSLPGARLSGRLVGVVSLTDVLNLFARASGLHPADPAETRSRRRRSSSSSLSFRRSGDVGKELLNNR